MAVPKTKKKRVAKKSTKKELPVVHKITCQAHKGDPCIARALMIETIMEALCSTVWHIREDAGKVLEFVVRDISIALPENVTNGHFSLVVKVEKLHPESYDFGETMPDMPLHNFLQTFVPTREIDISDCQA